MSEPQVARVVEVGQLLVNRAGLAKALSVSQRTVDYWRERGVIPYLSFGKRFFRFDIAEVRQAVEKYNVRPKAKSGKESHRRVAPDAH